MKLKAIVSFLLAASLPLAVKSATFESKWWLTRESLSDYEEVRSFSTESRVQCTAVASFDSAVQLATFNIGLCTHFRCRMGLSLCRKCRSVNQGPQEVWTGSNDCWTTVQHRVSDSVDFYRNWSQYQSEFGEGPNGNYWIGLDNLHALTSARARKLRFLLRPWNGSLSWAEYVAFSVGPESDNYRLTVSGFSSSPGLADSLTAKSNGKEFTTFDADHDTNSGKNCATEFAGAWWFESCFDTHPNGLYFNYSTAVGNKYALGIIWRYYFEYYYSLKEIEMLIY